MPSNSSMSPPVLEAHTWCPRDVVAGSQSEVSFTELPVSPRTRRRCRAGAGPVRDTRWRGQGNVHPCCRRPRPSRPSPPPTRHRAGDQAREREVSCCRELGGIWVDMTMSPFSILAWPLRSSAVMAPTCLGPHVHDHPDAEVVFQWDLSVDHSPRSRWMGESRACDGWVPQPLVNTPDLAW